MRQAGFSLIEVLVALAVIGIAVGALLTVQSESARTMTALEQRHLAQIVAENRMVEQRLGPPPPVGTTEGTMRLADRQWRWRMQVRRTAEAELNRIELSVTAAEADQVLARLTGFRGR